MSGKDTKNHSEKYKMIESSKTNEIIREAKRIEEDALHSGKSHLNVSAFWSKANYLLGIPIIIFAALRGVDFFSGMQYLPDVIDILIVILAALQTFLNPADHIAQRKQAGDKYFALKNQVRCFCKIELPNLKIEEATETLKAFSQKRDELNADAPSIPYLAFVLAKRSIEKGHADYAVDKEL